MDQETGRPTVGFVGLGVMGRGMAANVRKHGYPLTVFDVDRGALRQIEATGARVAASLPDLARASTWIILCLPDTEAVERVLFGEDGLLPGLAPGQVIIDCGTTHPFATTAFENRLRTAGVCFLDGPVSGMEARAREGSLTMMVGGEEAVFGQVEGLLRAMASTVVHMGGPGTGQLAKMMNNVLFNISAAAIAEILPLAARMDVDVGRMIDVVSTGTGMSFALTFFGPLILNRDFGPGYPLGKAFKDMEAIQEVARSCKAPVPVTMGALETYRAALAEGYGKENKGAMVKVCEKALGVTVRSG